MPTRPGPHHGRRRRWRPPAVRQRLAVLAALAVLATACSATGEDAATSDPDGSATDVAPAVEESATATAPADGPNDAAPEAPAGSREFVQDLWILERVQLVDARGNLHDRTDDLVEDVATHDLASFDLADGLRFHVSDALAGAVGRPDGTVRDDVHVVAGLVETEDGQAIAMLATPLDGAPPIGAADTVSIDVTSVSDTAVGAPVIVDMAFVQSIPIDSEPEDAGGLELFAARLADEAITYFGELDPVTGDGEVMLFTGHLGAVVAGSERVEIPAKARDMTDSVQKGARCLSGIRCVARFFNNFRRGALSSFDSALNNRPPRGDQPRTGDQPRPNHGPSPVWLPPACTVAPCGSSAGEPHLRTLDGTRITFMGVGEYVLAARDDLQVQVRYGTWRELPNVSVTTGLAVAAGDTRFTIQLEGDAPVLRVDGAEVDWDDLGDTLDQVDWEVGMVVDRTVQVTTPDGHRVTVTSTLTGGGAALHAYLDVADTEGGFVGLLGNANGDPDDDFVTRDGVQLPDVPAGEELYTVFGDSWRISDEESLFDYRPGTSTADFTDPSLPPDRDRSITDLDDVPAGVRATATTVCEAVGVRAGRGFDECVFDVAMSGSVAFAAAAVTNDLVEQILDGTLSVADAAPWLATSAPGGAGPPGTGTLDERVFDIDWIQTLYAHLGAEDAALEVGEVARFRCPAAADAVVVRLQVYGAEGSYADISPLCAAALHTGAITPEGGTFRIEYLGDRPLHEVSDTSRNQVEVRELPRRWPAFRITDGAD